MAEVRKFNPASNAIRDAVAKAMGEPVRPTTPGEPAKQAATPRTQGIRADVFTSATPGFTVPASAPRDEED